MRRLFFISTFVFFLFFLLILQFYKIQIIEGEKWARNASIQHHYTVVEPFMRGRFFAYSSLREGHPEKPQALVVDVPKFHLYIDPLSIPLKNKKELFNKLNSIAKDKKEKSKIWANITKKCRSRKIVSWIDLKEKEELLKWWIEYARSNKIAKNALFFELDYKRSYPFGSLFGQVIHTVQDEKEPNSLQSYPTGGLELYFNDYLKGKVGSRQILRSPRHSFDVGKIVSIPENGADIFLTLDRYLQAIAEEELEKGVKAANAKSGWAVIMNPYSGEIYALAQYPFFDLNHYSSYFNDPHKEEHTRHKAVTDAFDPGSIFKPVTLAICLKANDELKKMGKPPLFSPFEKVATFDGKFPGRSKPIEDTHKHYYLNMFLGLQKSSNVYMARMTQRVVERMGVNWYREQLALLGFGQKTGIESNAENVGLLPMPGKVHPNGKLEWSLGTPFSIAFGHNILINSMQMCRCYAIIANGGFDVKPTLLKKIVKGDLVVFENKPIENPIQILSKETVALLIQAMKYVTKPGGTARHADIPLYTEAGKTGTSEKIVNGHYSHDKFISSFVGFAPLKHPQFVLMVTVDEPKATAAKTHQGGACAAPIFREIGKRALEYLGVAPDDPLGYPGSPEISKSDWMPEVKRLSELYKEWNSR